jgi:hypothetical protein
MNSEADEPKPNVDIIAIHNEIILGFQNDYNDLPCLQKKINDLKMLEPPSRQTRLKKHIDEQIHYLEKKFDDIKSQRQLNFYIIQVTPLLENYKNELEKPIKQSFMNYKPADAIVKESLVEQYLDTIKKYSATRGSGSGSGGSGGGGGGGGSGGGESKLVNCIWCNEKLENNIESDFVISCSSCGTEQELYELTFSYKDSERINITSKYTYDRRIHFRDCMNQYQGKQNSTIPKKVYDCLWQKIDIYGLDRCNVTKSHIYMFLKEVGYSKHYEDINLIYKNITGQALVDITHLEDTLMKDFDILNNLYDKEYAQTKKISRKTFINTQYVLYQLLKRHKHPCDINDFNFLKTTERRSFHDEICGDLFNQLNWNFTNVF